MLKGRRHLPTFSDGVVSAYRERERGTEFGARRNPRSLEDLELVVTLCYEEMTCREQDFEFASMRGFSLSKKVRTHHRPEVDSGCRALIGDDLYSIGHIDRSKSEMYLYMTSVGKLEVPDGS